RPRASYAAPASRIPGSAARCSAGCRPSSFRPPLLRDETTAVVTAAADDPKDATAVTRALNRAVLDALPFDDTQDFDDARRGLLATLPEVEIKNAQGRVVWSLRDYAFLDPAEAPPTVNPSLWRQARLNMHHGLFQVTDRIYQIRGFDTSSRQPESAAPATPQHAPRALPGHRPHLPDPRLRHLQHDDPRGRARHRRDRPADLHRDGACP